jgi:hypothetical protein
LDKARLLSLSQRRNELFVSGYYWCPPTAISNDHCVAWLDPDIDGSYYAGKHYHIAKLTFMFAEDTLADFMPFYTALRAGLNLGGFKPHLLPILPCIHPDVDLVLTPIVESSALVIGIGNDPNNLWTPGVKH